MGDDATTPAGRARRPTTSPLRGESFGRYLVLEPIGRGGMGLVCAAYDPELDRRVALKLWSDTSDDGQRQARLLAEAKALAQLSHPHVVTVFDVGTKDHTVYMAMELLPGGTLAARIEESGSTPEVLQMFADAARGLAAAHRAGLCHGDFKPGNVLLTAEGRAKVADFGLAVGLAPAGEPVPGQVAGTPKYMAPEMLAGHAATPASDQYAFCVALFEALTGEPPATGEVETVTSAKVPPRLRSVLRQGLRPDPEDRFDGMDSILEALQRRPSSWARHPLVWVGAGAAAIVLGVRLAPSKPDRCQPDPLAWEALWDESARGELETASAREGVTFGEEAAEKIEAALEDHVQRWNAARVEACRSAAEPTDPLYARRLQCLSRSREEVRTLLHALLDAEPSVWGRGVIAAQELSRPEECLGEAGVGLHLPPPETPGDIERIERTRERLAHVRVLERLGLYDEGLTALEEPTVEVEGLGYPPLRAELLLRRGRLHEARGEAQQALEDLKEAHWIAESSDHQDVAAEAATLVTFVLATKIHDYDAAEDWRRHAEVAVGHHGLGDQREAELLNATGVLAMERGDLERARLPLQRALALKTEVWGPDHHQIAVQTSNLAILMERLGKWDEAETLYEQALQLTMKTLGPNHPRTASCLHDLAVLAMQRGRAEECVELHRRALEIKQRVLPAGHPSLGFSHDGLGLCLVDKGRLDEAIAEHRRAIEIFMEAYGPEHPTIAGVLNNLGNALRAAGRTDEADEVYRRALTVMESTRGPEHMDVATVHNSLAMVATDRGQWDVALDHLRRSRAIQAAAVGEDHPGLLEIDANLARVLANAGKIDEARELIAAAAARAGGLPDEDPRRAYVVDTKQVLDQQPP